MVIFGRRAKQLIAKVEELESKYKTLQVAFKAHKEESKKTLKRHEEEITRLKGLDSSIEKQGRPQKSQDQILYEYLNGPDEDNEGGK